MAGVSQGAAAAVRPRRVAYVDFMPEDETDRLPAAWGPNYARLAAIKASYDPKNLLRVNQNIQPAAV